MNIMKVYSQGDQAIVVSLKGALTPEATERLLVLRQYLLEQNYPFITEIVPTETDMLISYDARQMMKHLNITSPFLHMKSLIEKIDLSHKTWDEKRHCIRVPIYYGGEYGPDFDSILDELGITRETYIQQHTAPEYFVSMMGFSPGFPYLSGLPEALAVNHTAKEKQYIPAGSVILENKKCGITTTDTYEDWLVIGYTPLKLFDVHREDMVLMSIGDHVKFYDAEERGGAR